MNGKAKLTDQSNGTTSVPSADHQHAETSASNAEVLPRLRLPS